MSVELVPERVARSLRGARRLLILGSPGAGKSTLGRALAPRLALPLVALDREFWSAGWVAPGVAEWRTRRVPELIARERWIIEGQYLETLALRLTRAEAVLHLDFPRLLCLARVLRRQLVPEPRPDLPPGCPERLDPSFLRDVWRSHDSWRRSGSQLLEEASARLPVGRLRDPRDLDRFLRAL